MATAAHLLGYSRTTVYTRIGSGDLDSVVDQRGHVRVTLASIRAYLANPPPGSWERPGPPREAPPDDELRIENVRLRETVSRLQMAREREAASRQAEAAANAHLREALAKQAEANQLAAEAGEHLHELLTQFLTPDSPAGA